MLFNKLKQYERLNPEDHMVLPVVSEISGSPLSFLTERTTYNYESDSSTIDTVMAADFLREDVDGLTYSLEQEEELCNDVAEAEIVLLLQELVDFTAHAAPKIEQENTNNKIGCVLLIPDAKRQKVLY